MMKKRNNNNGKRARKRNPYKVDVAGSTPAAPTTLRIPKHIQVLEIPEGRELVTRVQWDGFEAKLTHVIRRSDSKRFDFGLKSRRSGSRSARSA